MVFVRFVSASRPTKWTMSIRPEEFEQSCVTDVTVDWELFPRIRGSCDELLTTSGTPDENGKTLSDLRGNEEGGAIPSQPKHQRRASSLLQTLSQPKDERDCRPAIRRSFKLSDDETLRNHHRTETRDDQSTKQSLPHLPRKAREARGSLP